MRIVFATGNANKVREIKAILADLNMEVLSMKEAGVYAEAEENGVTFADMSAHIDPNVEIGEGTAILPGVILQKGTKIGRYCTIGPNTIISNGVIGDGVTVTADAGITTLSRLRSRTMRTAA